MIKSVASFQKNSSFYGELDLVLTVKSFDLQAIRKRYLASKKNKSGRSGSVERREVAKGGIVTCKLSGGTLSINHEVRNIAEPRGIAFNKGMFAFSAEKEVFVIKNDGSSSSLTNPWFSYIHTVDFSENNERVLVSSSGFDLIQEWNLESKALSREWLAWENGFNKAVDPKTGEEILLSRQPSTNTQVHTISDPTNQVLPTAMRAAFINSVTYLTDDEVLATFFHEGKVFKINLNSAEVKPLIDGMKNPHGGRKFNDGYLATSTGHGKLHWLTDNAEKQILSLSDLPCKPSELGEMEWVQNAICTDKFIIAIDSNRTSFVIIDPINELYDVIPYDNNWAIQDGVLASLSNEQLQTLHNLV